ncbi:MAG: TadE/TadG family type IV pilus assembly protein [Alphaproteobacteria bacterium]
MMYRWHTYWVRFARARQGIAAVEFVLILPLITLLLFGTIDIGRLLFDYQAVSKSVRDATRYLTRIPEATLWDGVSSCNDPNGAGPIAEARNLALRGTIDTTDPYLLSFWTDPTTVTVSASCTANTADPKVYQGFFTLKDQIPSITVSATVSFPFLNGWLLGMGTTLTFTVDHEEVHYGQ